MNEYDTVLARWGFWLTLLPYGYSLVLPTIHVVDSAPWKGWHVLVLGWMSLQVLVPAWLANIFYATTVALHRTAKPSVGLFLSTLATLCALSAFLFPWAIRSIDFSFDRYGIGFYLWLSSIVATLLLSSILMIRSRKERSNKSLQPTCEDARG